MLLPVCLAAALLAAPAAAPGSTELAAVEGAERDWEQPPPGAPEDRALWTELRASTNAAVTHLARLSQLMFRLRYAKYYEELDARIAADRDAARARELRARLADDVTAAAAAVPAPELKIRGCRYVLLDLEQRMEEPPGTPLAEELPAVRTEATDCDRRLTAFVARFAPHVTAVERALDDVDRFLGRAAPGAVRPAADFLPEAP